MGYDSFHIEEALNNVPYPDEDLALEYINNNKT